MRPPHHKDSARSVGARASGRIFEPDSSMRRLSRIRREHPRRSSMALVRRAPIANSHVAFAAPRASALSAPPFFFSHGRTSAAQAHAFSALRPFYQRPAVPVSVLALSRACPCPCVTCSIRTPENLRLLPAHAATTHCCHD